MTYLKINPAKLKLILWLENLKRLRRGTTGVKKIAGKKVWYFGKLEIKL